MVERSPIRVVQLTPPGRAAVASILVQGPDALEVVQAKLAPQGRLPLQALRCDRPALRHFGSGPSEEIILRRRSDESLELHCHGGHAALARIEKALLDEGCVKVRWQDWVAAGDQDPIAAAAQIALAEARTERTAAILLDQYCGALRRAIDEIQEALRKHQTDRAAGQLERLLARADVGRHLVRPWRVVLAGRPNVGKSCLINALVGYQRAIVHHAPGTTRDVVTATTAVEGWPIELSDTAGLQLSRDAIEQAGMELARRKLAAAELVILVFDAGKPWQDTDRGLVAGWPGSLIVHNKCDLEAAEGDRPPGIRTSAVTGKGIGELVQAIARRLVPDPPPPGAAVPFTEEQVGRLRSLSARG